MKALRAKETICLSGLVGRHSSKLTRYMSDFAQALDEDGGANVMGPLILDLHTARAIIKTQKALARVSPLDDESINNQRPVG